MTHRPIKILEDGTRVYADYHRYKPMADEDRTYKVRKPDDPRAVRFHGEWFVPLEVLPDKARTMPPTRPDDEALEHAKKTFNCRCEVCRRPAAEKYRRIAREEFKREQRLRRASASE